MKNNYIVPAQRSIEIDATEMMAWSINGTSNKAYIDTSVEEESIENIEFDAKGNSIWDTEW